MKKRILMAMLLSCTMIFSACGGAEVSEKSSESKQPENSEVELEVMHYFTAEEAAAGDPTREIPRERFLSYDEEHDGVKLNISEMQHDDYETKIQALAAADDLPDVFLVKGSWIGNFVESELLAEVTPYLENCVWKDEYRPSIFNPAIVNDAVFAAPTQYSATTLCFYNKAIWNQYGFDAIPATWEELIEVSDKLEADGIYPVVLGNKDKWQYNSSWISAIGNRYAGTEWFENILKKDGSAHFTDEDFVKALAMTQNIGQNAGLNPDYSTIDHQQAASLYAQGKSATFIDGYWSIQYLIDNCKEDVLSNTVITALPTVEGAKGEANGVASGCGWFLAVNADLEGEKLDAAMDLILDMTGPKTTERFASEYGQLNSCLAPDDMDLSKFPQLQQDFVTLLNDISPIAIWDARIDASVIATMNDYFPELLSGTIAPEEAAEQIEAEYAKTLEN